MTYFNRGEKHHREVIGLIPAGGQATRIAPLPCSKELYPVGFRRVDKDTTLRPKVVCHYLLEKMRLVDVTKAYIILREGKWDIPAYLRDGKIFDMHLSYLMMHLPFGVPYTLDQAYPFVQDAIVALGFPDIIFQPDDAFVQLIDRQADSQADIVLGLFPTDQPQKWDMVDLDEDARIRRIIIKPQRTHLRYAWGIAIWTPVFTRFMHEYVADLQGLKKRDSAENNSSEQRELFVGDVIQAAIQNDMHIDTVVFPDGNCLDIGTPEDIIKVAQNAHRIS